MLSSPASSDLEGHILGGCRLLGRLSRGAMGEVYLAEQLSLGNRLVAVKVVPARAAAVDETTVPIEELRFLHEAQVLAQFAHPNILTIHDSGISNDLLYLVMQYVPDGSLADLMRGKGHAHLELPLAPERVAVIVRQIASALQYTHDHGMVHRDVKPSNVLVHVQPDGSWHLLLADFGIARNAESTANFHRVSGTIAYMAPEQLTGRFSPASDQYSLAVLAYLLLTGRTPFQGSAAEVMAAHRSAPAPDLRELNPAVPAAVAVVVERALAKRPQDRWPSVMAFSQTLSQAADGSPDDVATRTAEALAPAAALMPLAAEATVPGEAAPAVDPHATTVFGQPAQPAQPAQSPPALDVPTVPLAVSSPWYPAPRSRRRLLLTVLAALVLAALTALAAHALRPAPSHPALSTPPSTTPRTSPVTGPSGTPGGSLAPSATSTATSAPKVAPTVAPTASPTAAPTATPTAAPTATPTAQPTPTPSPTATPEPSPTATPASSTSAADAAQVSAAPARITARPGKTVVLHTMLTNTGTATWSSAAGYAVACDTQSHPNASCANTPPIGLDNHTVAPGKSLHVSVRFAAPTTPGTYQLWWNLTHDGTFFTTPDGHMQITVNG